MLGSLHSCYTTACSVSMFSYNYGSNMVLNYSSIEEISTVISSSSKCIYFFSCCWNWNYFMSTKPLSNSIFRTLVSTSPESVTSYFFRGSYKTVPRGLFSCAVIDYCRCDTSCLPDFYLFPGSSR